LLAAEHPAHALWTYESERLPPTAQIVRMNRSGGPEGVIDAVEARAPEGFDDINAVLSYEDRKAIVRGYAATAGFAREQVNAPPREAAVAR
jgi:5-methylphenazine-1-carboxylate 1-monooxygenase